MAPESGERDANWTFGPDNLGAKGANDFLVAEAVAMSHHRTPGELGSNTFFGETSL